MTRYTQSIIILLATLCLVTGSASARTAFKVTHVSVDHVYLDGGTADSLQVGDRLQLKRSGSIVTELEVVFAARHSASCKIISGSQTVQTNDLFEISQRVSPEIPTEPSVDTVATDTIEKPVVKRPETYESPAPPSRVRGSVSLLYSNWLDNSDANLDFSQTTARLNIRAKRLWQRDISLVVRTRGRYDVRQRGLSGAATETEWKNRLWEASLTWRSENGDFMVAAGRLLPRRISTAGYLDGGHAEARISGPWRLGAFGGIEPNWAYNDNLDRESSLKRAGGYVAYSPEPFGAQRIDQSVGYVAEYIAGMYSRTFISAVGSIRNGSWGISHTAELDVNTGWRKEKNGNSLSLSNLYVYSYYRFSRAVRASLSYDNRQNYWTYDSRSVADSIFDDRTRHGVRTSLNVSPARYLWLHSSLGYRKRDGDPDPTYTYSAGIRRSSLFNGRFSLGLSVAGFDGAFANGFNYAVRGEFNTSGLGVVDFSTGEYRYTVDNVDAQRSSRFFALGNSYYFADHYYLNSNAEYNTGDDIDGLRLQLEIGYRY